MDSCPDRWGQILMKRREADMDVVLSTAGFYRLASSRAKKIIDEVCAAVGAWQSHARKLGLNRQECAEAEHLFCSAYNS